MRHLNIAATFEAVDRTMIEAWIANQQEENLHLEFKTLSNVSMKGPDDKKNLAKTVSGFANSGGGILVWGVKATKNGAGLDCASAVECVSHARQLVSRLNSLTGECVSPVVDGVRHRAIIFDGDRGCAITLVPESTTGPHMAKLGEDRYYKRSGDSFYRMEHYDLNDMFGRRQKPDLSVAMVFEDAGAQNLERLRFKIKNVGKRIAKYSGMLITFSDEINIVSVETPLCDASAINGGHPTLSYIDNFSVIHPNNINYNIGSFTFSRENRDRPLKFELKVYCDEMMCENHAGEILCDGSIRADLLTDPTSP